MCNLHSRFHLIAKQIRQSKLVGWNYQDTLPLSDYFNRYQGLDLFWLNCLQTHQVQYRTGHAEFFIIFFQRNRGSTWGGGNLNSMTSFSSTLGEWLNHIQNILVGASWIAAQIAEEAASVLVHCRFLSPPVSLSCTNLHECNVCGYVRTVTLCDRVTLQICILWNEEPRPNHICATENLAAFWISQDLLCWIIFTI